MQKTFLFAKTFSNFFNKIGRQYPYGVLAVLKKNCLTDYSLLTIHTGIASTACVMTQGVIASTACVYTHDEIASTAYGRPQTVFLQIFHEQKSVKIAHRWNIPLTPLRAKFRNFLCEVFKFLRLKNPPTKHDIFNKIRPFLMKESSQTMEKREHKNHFALCLSNDEFHILKENFIDSNMKDESAFLRI